jgi:hypothetical protein
MLSNDIFYWGSIRKIVVAFGSLFSDIHFERTDDTVTPSVIQTIKVPLAYGPKEKWLIARKQNEMPQETDMVEMTLPRMSYEITGFVYDESRKITSTGRTVKTIINDNTVLQAQYNPVPYNIGFQLNIMTKTIEDSLMIVEQILPFFTPDYTLTIMDIPELALEKEINMVLNNVQHEDTWDGNFETRRTITWVLSFTAKAYLYPPIKLTKLNLQTTVNFDIDGSTSQAANSLPYNRITGFGSSADIVTESDLIETKSDTTVKIFASPSSVSINAGQSKTFSVMVINAQVPNPNPYSLRSTDFTANVPITTQTTNDLYSIDSIHGTFTYTSGTGVRTTQETIIVQFASSCDPSTTTTILLILNP